MHPIVYDACRLLGLGLATAGAAVLWGAGVALLVAGGLLIALTEIGARR